MKSRNTMQAGIFDLKVFPDHISLSGAHDLNYLYGALCSRAHRTFVFIIWHSDTVDAFFFAATYQRAFAIAA